MMARFDYHRPRSLEEAQRLKAETPGSRYIAGGTDLLVLMKSGRESPRALISLRSLRELTGIEVGDGAAVGAMTSFTDILEHRELCRRYPVLAQAVRTVGSVQIRNAATLGGNLCNAIPCADGALPLLVLDARLRVLGAGARREIPVDEFFVEPRRSSLEAGEVLATILIDPPAPASRGIFLKKTRLRKDLALASVAVHLEMGADGESCRRVRVAAGSVAPVPLRLKKVERHLEGGRITADSLRRARDLAAEEISPITDIRASADYRRHITGVLLQRAVESLLGRRLA